MLSNDAVMRAVGLAGPLLEKAAKGLIHVNLATISVAVTLHFIAGAIVTANVPALYRRFGLPAAVHSVFTR